MQKNRWQFYYAFALILLTVILHYIHYLIFHDLHHIFIYGLGDLAFIPLEVLLVSLILHQLLTTREKKARLEKLNMVIGTFFSEIGTELLAYLSDYDPCLPKIKTSLVVEGDWSNQKFNMVHKQLIKHPCRIDIKQLQAKTLRELLLSQKDFFLRLLENPNLLEHESFTELLWSVFHLTEELRARNNFNNLPETDFIHLSNDVHRVYRLLIQQWLDYMKHLRYNYPFLFSLAMRTNPFDQSATPIVKS